MRYLYFNPHLPCGRRPIAYFVDGDTGAISIHTFLAEGDDVREFIRNVKSAISIHTFLAEGDRKYKSNYK